MIRVGLVGYGLAGANFHAPLIRACGRMQISGVMTSRDIPDAVPSLDALLQRSDLIVVASPNATHFDITKAALEAGKHVVVDKPFTATVEQADQLIALADECALKLTVFHNRRWDSDFLTVRKVLPELGEVKLYSAHWDRFRPALREGWKEQPDGVTGVLIDLGPHLIDQVVQLFGKPGSVSADVAAQRTGSRVDDYFELTMHYGEMRAVLGSSSLVADARPRFAIHGDRGSFVKYGLDTQEEALKGGANPLAADYGRDANDGSLTGADGNRRTVPSERGRYLDFYEGVADAILDGAPVPVSARDARDVMALIALAKESAREGRRLSLPPLQSV
ncbi:MAG: oxidoreductase [Sphingomicrobium sp.]